MISASVLPDVSLAPAIGASDAALLSSFDIQLGPSPTGAPPDDTFTDAGFSAQEIGAGSDGVPSGTAGVDVASGVSADASVRPLAVDQSVAPTRSVDVAAPTGTGAADFSVPISVASGLDATFSAAGLQPEHDCSCDCWPEP